MSTGFSGNMGFPMPVEWHFNQILEIPVQFPGGVRSIPIDKDVVSSKARPVSLASVVSPPVELDGSVSVTGFDAFFEWVVRAEVACERGLVATSTLLHPLEQYAPFIPSYVAHWLQKPDYWDLKWREYTPLIDSAQDQPLARSAAEFELGQLSPSKPASTRDIAHFAASLRGYEVWGVPTTLDSYGLGDLGGWALDLLQIWGSYQRAQVLDASLDLMVYLTEHLGVRGAVGGFGWDDVVADADAYLVARALSGSGSSMSGTHRGLLKLTSSQRVRKFHLDRFGAAEVNVVSAVVKLADGIDVGTTNCPWTTLVLLKVAKADRMPTPEEAQTCGQAYARMMMASQG